MTQVIEPETQDAATVTDAPWDGAASRFTDDQYRSAAAACDPNSGNTPKAQCFLPHHEPGGAINRNGVHAAAGRVNQVKGKSADSVAAARSHLRSHYTRDLNEDPPDSLAEDDDEALGGKPSKGTPADKRLRQNKNKPPAYAGSDSGADTTPAGDPQWRGVLVVEGTPTGDGREFAPDAIQWADMPLPLRWQMTDSHGGMPTNETVRVGNITRVWRDGASIMGEGFFDLGGPDDDPAHEAFRRMDANTLNGVSIDADDITDADIEYVFPKADDAEKDEDDEDDLFFLLFAAPEKIVFHSARIRAATLCDIPAFVEAQLHLIGDDDAQVASATPYDPVAAHRTETSNRKQWDAAANEALLPRRMTHRIAEGAYAWIDRAAVENGEVDKRACKLLHHEVLGEGTPGPANLTSCASLIALLESSKMNASDKRGVYTHLAQHMRDGGLEPLPYDPGPGALLAHAWHDEWRPPRDWFTDPNLGQAMPILVTNEGRVYGHAAQWGQCHLGYMSECVMAPHEDYHAYFMTGEVVCVDGTRVAVGQITAGIDHAPLHMRASSAKQHYDNTEAVVADVVVGNDAHGIWVAGGVRPWAQTSRVAALRGSGQVSPDWRRIGGTLRMVALLTVNTSGYHLPRARSLVAGREIQSLVSSGMVVVQNHGPSEEELNQRALRLMQKTLADRVHGRTS